MGPVTAVSDCATTGEMRTVGWPITFGTSATTGIPCVPFEGTR